MERCCESSLKEGVQANPKGSRIIVENAEGKFAVVPRKDQIKKGTLLSIIEQAGVTKEEFIALL